MEQIELKNLLILSTSKLPFQSRPIELEDMEDSVVVYYREGYEAQRLMPEFDEVRDKNNYYIPKYNIILTFAQFKDFVESHSTEKFLLVSESDDSIRDIWVFSETEPYKIKMTFFNRMGSDGYMKKLATIQNVEGTADFEPAVIFNDSLHIREMNDNYSRDAETCHHFCFNNTNDYYNNINRFHWINHEDRVSTGDLVTKELVIPGKTRVIFSYSSGSSYRFSVKFNQLALASERERYGIRPDEVSRGYYSQEYFHHDEIFPDAPLPIETLDRVKKHLINTLETKEGKISSLNSGRYWYYNNSNDQQVIAARMLVISAPVPKHRRPTYHYFLGVKSCGAIDVVEVARGELQMKDMTPVNVYYLNADTGNYNKISYGFFGAIRDDIIDKCEIDKVSFTEWNEDNEDHRELLAALAEYGISDDLDLTKIKLLRRLPFGSLFIEQLIKTGHSSIAYSLAERITEQADNLNYNCGSLLDIFPGCNPAGNSVMEVLKMNKPCLNLLMEGTDSQIGTEYFISKYNAIKQLVENGVLTSNNSKLVQQYMFLQELGWHKYSCGTGRTIDIVNYPDDIKSLYKMANRINNLFSDYSYEARRFYQEITSAYFQFKDFGWNPAESLIFIEFSLGDKPRDALEMLSDREKAANKALQIYRDKINEVAHARIEQTYASRKSVLHKLESTDALQKSDAFKNYVVIMPSQIYGLGVNGSIEKEGRDMDHCVFRQYADTIANGTYTVLYLRHKDSPEKSLVTIGINQQGRINQTYSCHDNPINQWEAEAIIAWAKSKEGLVTFQAEDRNIDVLPGGWYRGPSSPVLPTLPKPNADWLKKLATVVQAE